MVGAAVPSGRGDADSGQRRRGRRGCPPPGGVGSGRTAWGVGGKAPGDGFRKAGGRRHRRGDPPVCRKSGIIIAFFPRGICRNTRCGMQKGRKITIYGERAGTGEKYRRRERGVQLTIDNLSPESEPAQRSGSGNWCLRFGFKFPVIANQSADWCGNPPVEWNQVAITTTIRTDSSFSGAFRYISSLTGGLPRPVCGLVSQ